MLNLVIYFNKWKYLSQGNMHCLIDNYRVNIIDSQICFINNFACGCLPVALLVITDTSDMHISCQVKTGS